jgi:hypothetical protein
MNETTNTNEFQHVSDHDLSVGVAIVIRDIERLEVELAAKQARLLELRTEKANRLRGFGTIDGPVTKQVTVRTATKRAYALVWIGNTEGVSVTQGPHAFGYSDSLDKIQKRAREHSSPNVRWGKVVDGKVTVTV